MAKKQKPPQGQLWSKLRPVAEQMRQEPAAAEQILWKKLRGRGLNGFKFRRQHAIDRFMFDYYCREAALILEIDGPIHEKQTAEDQERQGLLTSLDFHFLRFTNDPVYSHVPTVLTQILQALEAYRQE